VIRPLAAAAIIGAVLLAATACNNGGSDPTGSDQPTTPPVTGRTTPGGTTTTPVTPEPIPTGNPTKTPAGGVPRPAQVNSRDATAVAVTVATVTYRHDTAIDNSPSDAQRRARPWLAAALAAQLDGGPVAAPGAEWNSWAKHRAYTTSTARNATESGAPEDTPTRADRTIAVTMQPVGRDRWRGGPQQYALFVTLTRISAKAPWQVSQMQVQE
jgi:hypothetical protein